ncbi:hypothetical protein MicB006_4489 [Micromonospora sp. B006]|nr:hypothetical protein MicB006_4489 [Micromonospora sp. B006]
MSFPTRTFSPVGSCVRRGRQEGLGRLDRREGTLRAQQRTRRRMVCPLRPGCGTETKLRDGKWTDVHPGQCYKHRPLR